MVKNNHFFLSRAKLRFRGGCPVSDPVILRTLKDQVGDCGAILEKLELMGAIRVDLEILELRRPCENIFLCLP